MFWKNKHDQYSQTFVNARIKNKLLLGRFSNALTRRLKDRKPIKLKMRVIAYKGNNTKESQWLMWVPVALAIHYSLKLIKVKRLSCKGLCPASFFPRVFIYI